MSQPASFPYHEPYITTILLFSSFLITLNVLSHLFDQLLYCGLLAQILLGITFGTPGAGWLPPSTETVLTQLGYLGLVLLVFEGGLSTPLSAMRANAGISIAVATTGILFPIGTSFVLMRLTVPGATSLQAFAAGAALCSTSLGTTFTVLKASGLADTRLGVVLSTAAMLDDVVGLVMVQVIAELGGGGREVNAATVLRPVGTSLAMVILILGACWVGTRPVNGKLAAMVLLSASKRYEKSVEKRQAIWIAQTLILMGMVTGATYAGTSNLFAAYMAGAAISWCTSRFQRAQPAMASHRKIERTGSMPEDDMPTTDHDPAAIVPQRKRVSQANNERDQNKDKEEGPDSLDRSYQPQESLNQALDTFTDTFKPAMELMLKPFFFASIGFAIPITQMFNRAVVWRGLIYSLLMFLAKMLTGLWLVRLALPDSSILHRLALKSWNGCCRYCCLHARPARVARSKDSPKPKGRGTLSTEDQQAPDISTKGQGNEKSELADMGRETATVQTTISPTARKPQSLYPGSIIGIAMVARGEIGYLIASLAESKGIFGQSNEDGESSVIYLIVVWAITLCTLLGPICVGLLVRRVKRLQSARREDGGREDPLGIWGVSSAHSAETRRQ